MNANTAVIDSQSTKRRSRNPRPRTDNQSRELPVNNTVTDIDSEPAELLDLRKAFSAKVLDRTETHITLRVYPHQGEVYDKELPISCCKGIHYNKRDRVLYFTENDQIFPQGKFSLLAGSPSPVSQKKSDELNAELDAYFGGKSNWSYEEGLRTILASAGMTEEEINESLKELLAKDSK